jgi:riboflavin-specific deaminase-like protein
VTTSQPSGPGPELRQLLPELGRIHVGELLASLNLAAHAPVDRPYTIVNFVASADGRAAFEGRSGGLSDPADREMFHGLREHVDAVLVGTGTLRTERYGRLVRDPERRHRRAASGLRPEPLACIFTRSGELPLDIPLFAQDGAPIVVFTPVDVDASEVAADLEVVRVNPGELTLTTMMRRLRSDYDVRSLLCEGGPTLFGVLLEEGLVDELFLSLSPKLTGGGNAPAITSGPELSDLRHLDLVALLELDSSLFLRYALR